MAGGHFSRRLKRSHASVTAEAQPERRNRHEVGHYFRDKPVRDGDRLKQCRASSATRHRLPGALKRHYAAGPPLDWQRHYVSAYATAHPWENFAETWAHLLHIVDTLEMAKAYDLKLAPAVDRDGEFAVAYGIDLYDAPDARRW